MNAFDINVRSVIAFREIVKGITAMQALCGYMNLVPPMQAVAYNNTQKEVAESYRTVANSSMLKAADELKQTSSDVAVSCEGSWQKRGFSSLNGLVTVISVDSGKCLVFRVKTNKSTAYSSWESRTGSDEYTDFPSNHECLINHEGSSGSMESDALVEIFKASETFNQLRYVEFLGDGETKSHHTVVVADPYHGRVVKKLECIGHVQKRVGSRLRKLKASYKGSKDNKKEDDRAMTNLTHKQINKLQNYYGIALRQYTGSSVYELKKSIGAALYHSSEADSDEQQHEMYPRDPNTWCTFHADVANKTSFYKKSGRLLLKAVKKIIKPIFMNLSDNELLEKCLHGKTQNNNESLNGMIWKKCPIDVYVGKCVLEMGVFSAVICFNEGKKDISDVLYNCCIEPGKFTKVFVTQRDNERMQLMDNKTKECSILSRKKLRNKRKGFRTSVMRKSGMFMVKVFFNCTNKLYINITLTYCFILFVFKSCFS